MALSMKNFAVTISLLVAVSPVASVIVRRGSAGSVQNEENQRTISQVVEMLQGMLDTSRQSAVDERKLYAKYKCYCDENEKTKTDAIATATKVIAQLENELEELLGSNGELSQEVAKLKADMDENEQQRTQADTLRGTEKTAFEEEEADLTEAIQQMGEAIETLAAIGADQTLQSSAKHDKFMAGYGKEEGSLVSLRSSVKKALLAAKAVLTPKQKATVNAFLQASAPFTGTYVAQSGEVVGILKNLKETFESNLARAQAAEKAAIKAHKDFIDTKTSEFDTMKDAHDEKADQMGTNDGDLSTKKPLLADEIAQKEADISFLAQLGEQCGEKVKDYEKRQVFRTSEDAAISEAIALLNSDAAFESFGKVKATSTGSLSFLQTASADQTIANTAAKQAASAAGRILQEAASSRRSTRLASIARLLALGNPFTKVLAEIVKMEEVIAAEGKQDQETLDWCNSERTTSDDGVKTKGEQITGTQGDIDTLDERINHPETGLLKLIADKEQALEDNRKAQSEQTDVRRTENADYQKEAANCQDATAILGKAIQILEKFYKKLEEEKNAELGLLQKAEPEGPAPPTTWEGDFAGQSEKGGNVVEMLKHVLTNTATEEETAHQTEMDAQHSYEDSMTTLKTQEDEATTQLASDRKELVEKKLELSEKRVDLENTEKEKLAIERYLEEIKPGCDFITENFETREGNRAAEKAALEKAVTLLKGTPAFAAAEATAKVASFGNCKETCQADEAHAECKACMKGVSVPGFCAGSPDTPGCA